MIYKYELNWNETTLTLPKGTNILSVGFQGDKLVIWVNTITSEPEQHKFYAYVTGAEVKKGQVYIGTAKTADDRFVLMYTEILELVT